MLANAEFGTLVSESSFGCTWSINSGENRLTPWRNDPVLDTPSEALYLRDEESAAVWSPTPRPAGGDAATPSARRGHSTYLRETHGLQQEITVFVPPGASLKVIRLRAYEQAAAASSTHRDLLRRMGLGQFEGRTACLRHNRGGSSPCLPARHMSLERRLLQSRGIPRLRAHGSRVYKQSHGVSRSSWRLWSP